MTDDILPATERDIPLLIVLDTVAAHDAQRRADIRQWVAQGVSEQQGK